jgi:hypothetical protein
VTSSGGGSLRAKHRHVASLLERPPASAVLTPAALVSTKQNTPIDLRWTPPIAHAASRCSPQVGGAQQHVDIDQPLNLCIKRTVQF